ncbi:DUF3817 domain-containing protein [Ketogulonicigenium robustum]|uniref:DUF3817 domain-containing protein n=1 Tax=Ketogulonicigenium robustum TaxID=92947 RepID=UPI000A2706F3|nr:DUF3817 domain-containing protein [Ketogulonicigenium robustum]
MNTIPSWKDPALGLFRIIAVIEGVTTLALFLVAMPLKYWGGNDALVPLTGQIHGYAFLLYLLGMVIVLPGLGWGVGGVLRTFVFSLFPFGTFINEPWLHRRHAAVKAALKPTV